ncbi:MAG: hypothetical protein LJE96_17540 [Deltaproteobacteria bacterium]|nr:hypothetical protein [Deltaproteobacteria bacterium]
MQTKDYRLGDYKIMESGTGELGWEAHFGVGEIKEGRCFKKGSILFIGPPERRSDGFLKFEHMARTKGFPDWLKTKYYCRGFEVYHCKTGRKVTKEEIQLWKHDSGIDGIDRRNSERAGTASNAIFTKGTSTDAFRLQRYEITKKQKDQIVWKTHAGPHTLGVGTCIILEDIIFMGSRQIEQNNLSKRQFLANLERLPQWHQTRYFSPKLSLHECKTEIVMQVERKRWSSRKRATENNTGRKRYKNGTSFGLKAEDLTEKGTAFLSHLAKKWLSYIADWLALTLPIFFAYLIRLSKKLKRKWPFKRGKNSSIHRGDD